MKKKQLENLMQKEYGLFINGDFKPSISGLTFETFNPVDGEMIARVSKANEEDVDRAVDSARKAFESWKLISAKERSDLLLKIADALEKNIEFLAGVESLDTGRAIIETREDIIGGVDQFRYFAGVIRSHEDSAVQHSSEAFSLILREPLGVVGQIVPWNFPFLISVWKIAPALAGGNTIVIKPASNTPLSLLEMAKILMPILPPGVLNIIPGSGRKCGERLINHQGIDKIAFTGSTDIGIHVAKVAAEKIIPATLELGGKSANIIFPDAPIKKAIEGATLGILYAQGQVCNAGSRLFVHKDVYDEVVDSLIRFFKNVVIGDPLDENTRMGSLVDENQIKSVLGFIEEGQKEGAKLVYGGTRLVEDGKDKGCFIKPALFTNVTNDMKIAQEEIFGPVLVVIKFNDEKEVIEMANDSQYGLAGGVWTKDINCALRVAKAVNTGTMWINEYNIVPSHSPFGGYKKSGFGREVHKMALESYTQVKNIYVSLSEEPCGWYD